MKAGRIGSIPGGVTKGSVQSGQPLKFALKTIGEAVANLNTAIVGLDAVENDYQKPTSLNVSWNPADRKIAARKSRRFIIMATLVCVNEALSEFVNATAKMPSLSQACADNKYSNAEKLIALGSYTINSNDYLIAGAVLLMHWRNRFVHPSSKASLQSHQISTLKTSADEIEQLFSGLSVKRLLNDFDENQPTLKDISSLIAMSIKLIRKIDSATQNLSKEDLISLLKRYGLDKQIIKITSETTQGKVNDSIIRLLNTEAPELVESYKKFDCLNEL